MKQLFFILLLLPTIVFGQQTKDTTKKAGISNIEKFSKKSGTLIQRELIDIGTVVGIGDTWSSFKKPNCKMKIEINTDLLNNEIAKGIRLEIYDVIANSINLADINYLDADELDATMKAIKIIQSTILNKKVEHYTELIFNSRGGFSFGCYYKENKWRFYMFDTTIIFNESEIDKLYSYLQDAKNKL